MNILLIPKFVTSGGIFESVNLCENSDMFGSDYFVISLFYSECKVENLYNITPRFLKNKYLNCIYLFLFFPLHLIIFNFLSLIYKTNVVYTHFFSYIYFNFFCFRYVFIQALEWHFLKNIFLKKILYYFINLFVVFSTPIFTNKFLFSNFPYNNKAKLYQIWADFPCPLVINEYCNRQYDIIFIIRNGFVKQSDKYFEFLRRYNVFRFAIVTNITVPVDISMQNNVDLFPLLSKSELYDLFNNSKFYVSFSYHEGFSLPCLESMFAGAIPVTLDCGGPCSFIPQDLFYLVKNNSLSGVFESICNLNESSLWTPLSERCHYIALSPPVFTRKIVDLY